MAGIGVRGGAAPTSATPSVGEVSLLIKDPEVANKTWTVAADIQMTVAEVVRMFLMRRNRHLTQACQLRLMLGGAVLSDHLEKTLSDFTELSSGCRSLLHSQWKPSAGGCFNAATCSRCIEISTAGRPTKLPNANHAGPARIPEHEGESPNGLQTAAHRSSIQTSSGDLGGHFTDVGFDRIKGLANAYGSQADGRTPTAASGFGSAPPQPLSSPTGGGMYHRQHYGASQDVGGADASAGKIPWNTGSMHAASVADGYGAGGRHRTASRLTDSYRLADDASGVGGVGSGVAMGANSTRRRYEQSLYEELSERANYRHGSGVSSAAVDLLSCLDRLVSNVGQTTDVVNHLERLDALRRSGALSQSEFMKAKHHVLYGGE